MINFPCVILSGGKSSRMGEDKSLLEFHNSTLVLYQYHRLSNIFKNIYISAKTDKFNENVNLIFDTNESFSPMIALDSIFNYLLDEYVFIVSVDTPFVDENIINKLYNNIQNYDVCIAKTQNFRHPLCGFYKTNLKILTHDLIKSNKHKIGMLLKLSKTNEVSFEDETKFLNVNTKLDYEKAKQTLKEIHDNSHSIF